MKIVFLQDDFPPHSFGGAGFSTYELALGMRKMGHEVFVITTCRNEGDAGVHPYDGLTVYSLHSNYSERWRAYRSLNNRLVVKGVGRILETLRPDVVHANNIHHHLSYRCLRIARQYAQSVIFTARDTMSVGYGKLSSHRYLVDHDYRITWLDNLRFARRRYNPFRNSIIRHYLSYVRCICAVSDELRRALEANGIQNVKTIHTGADTTMWGATLVEIDSFQKLHGVVGKKTLLFAGRLSAEKGGNAVVKVLMQVVRRIPDVVLLVAGGSDAYTNDLKTKVANAGYKDTIVTMGWMSREEMRVAYAASQIVIVPSLYLDPFPRAVIEAMASGKPIVGTCYGGAPEVILDGVTGYVVDPRDTVVMTEKVVGLLADTEKREQFGKAGYERIKTEFNLTSMLNRYLATYESALD